MLDPLASADLAQDQVFIAIQLRWNDRQDRLSNDFFRRIAKHALGSPVPTLYISVQVLAYDSIFPCTALFSSRLNSVFQFFLLRDVACNLGGADDVSILVFD